MSENDGGDTIAAPDLGGDSEDNRFIVVNSKKIVMGKRFGFDKILKEKSVSSKKYL